MLIVYVDKIQVTVEVSRESQIEAVSNSELTEVASPLKYIDRRKFLEKNGMQHNQTNYQRLQINVYILTNTFGKIANGKDA